MIDTKKIFLHGVMLLILLKMCCCLTVYNLNRNRLESFGDNDGAYQTTEHNNDEAFYRFGYRVNAFETGDIKHHVEERVKDEVKGAYFLIEPNGVGRLVQYIANANGFRAVVRRHQYGANYSTNFDVNNSTDSDPHTGTLHTNILVENKINNVEKFSEKKKVAVDRFLLKQNDKYGQQNVTYRQSSPKSITNQSSAHLPEEKSNEKFYGYLSNSTVQIPLEMAKTTTIERKQQYEVFDPDVDTDIRRNIPKPYLNLDKLKQPRQQPNNQ